MRIACCFSQTKNGVYLEQWKTFVESLGEADYFLHYYEPYKPAITGVPTIVSGLAQLHDLRGLMCTSQLKRTKELDNIFVYDMCVYANVDAPVPNFKREYLENIAPDHLYLQVDQGPFLEELFAVPAPDTNFMFGDSVTMSIASESINFKGVWKERYNTNNKAFFCYIQSTYLDTVDIRHV